MRQNGLRCLSCQDFPSPGRTSQHGDSIAQEVRHEQAGEEVPLGTLPLLTITIQHASNVAEKTEMNRLEKEIPNMSTRVAQHHPKQIILSLSMSGSMSGFSYNKKFTSPDWLHQAQCVAEAHKVNDAQYPLGGYCASCDLKSVTRTIQICAKGMLTGMAL